jgi:hypothetical protein
MKYVITIKGINIPDFLILVNNVENGEKALEKASKILRFEFGLKSITNICDYFGNDLLISQINQSIE